MARPQKGSSKKPAAPSNTEPKKEPLPSRPLPQNLRSLTSVLDPAKIYLVHVDTHPSAFKRKIFVVPVLLNVAVVAILLWRAYVILPYYLGLAQSMNGMQNQYTIDLAKTPRNQLIKICIRRAASFLIDWLLYSFLYPWPRDFFLALPASPWSWRWSTGFQENELVVRVSRNKEFSDMNLKNEDLQLSEKIKMAMDPLLLSHKTGYVLMNADWDLDFYAMTVAARLVREKKLDLEDFQDCALVSKKDVWKVWESTSNQGGDASGEGRRTIIEFRKKLSAMGKEDLFYRWIELVQYESTQPGGFTQERQMKTMKEAKQLFEKQGVDFDEFWESVGGMKYMSPEDSWDKVD